MMPIILAIFSLIAASSACTAPPGGCTVSICKKIQKLGVNEFTGLFSSNLFGYKYGIWNKAVSRSLENKKGGPVVSYEYFQEVGINGTILKTTSAKNLGDCCFACAQTKGCALYQFFPHAHVTQGKQAVTGFIPGKQCYLLTGGSYKRAGLPASGVPFSGAKNQDQTPASKKYDASWVGGSCNPSGSIKDDPHFTGAMGTRFDFNGELNKPFCLITDKDFHINVLLKGYEDDTAEKGLRSWIKEVGLLWTAPDGKTHSAHMVARNSKEAARGDGFMSRLALDNEVVAIPSAEGQEAKADGFTLRFTGVEKLGPYDVEHFLADVAGVAKLHLRMRVAHKKLQAPEDAEAHFNIEVVELKQTPRVHGVLGQTFRSTDEQVKKALKYSELAELLHAPVRADGETGKGFLDGSVSDYESSSVLAPDCTFSAFKM